MTSRGGDLLSLYRGNGAATADALHGATRRRHPHLLLRKTTCLSRIDADGDDAAVSTALLCCGVHFRLLAITACFAYAALQVASDDNV